MSVVIIKKEKCIKKGTFLCNEPYIWMHREFFLMCFRYDMMLHIFSGKFSIQREMIIEKKNMHNLYTETIIFCVLN